MNLNRNSNQVHADYLKEVHITENEIRQLEIKLKNNADIYINIYEEALEGIIFWTGKGQIVKANEAACRIFECSKEELVTKRIQDFIYASKEEIYQVYNNFCRKGAIRDELVFLMPNGQEKSLEFTSKLHAIDEFHMTIFRNVSETRRMEKELRESELKFRKIFEGALEGIILWKNDFTIVDINQAAEKMLSVSKKEIIGHSFIDLLTKLHLSINETNYYYQNLVNSGQTTGTIDIKVETGETKYIEFSARYNVLSELSLVTFKDITEKLQLDAQLRKSDTLNVIGELAAGIAHEIRNPMTALKGFIQLLEDSVKEDHSMYFNIISSELKRIDSIINEFLILAKPQAVKFIEVDLIKIMKETVDFLSAQALLHNIQFRTKYQEGLPPIFCEPNQLKKVFINLIKNAIEVMPKGGYIDVNMNSTKDGRLHISIVDEGNGIPKDKLEKLGQPFYTTKEKGTGLGLMVSYKIIKEHKGNIEVESELGVGTIFNIYLPLKKYVVK
ncbi:ATP-binding protein [Bacillus sp. DTU_2020_1000418_1_SI_GHA_SEK_038]|uniref:PAS domain-containing sensor histidine kinase n=1 Tax=Bacillus sp. DTU_2020_1000418_1_SI_GHA_SEK_038 TaxID=3077585 RepID=UPI0028E6A181|nr:ATP-binding protein [Bacillus sp. DTU_2020_1000418_1_SI_GHA_SEK_038]WNS76958.1 ATP-binding protein [Bacillus sp. DTU_2020_1000418_1_SI_GHA_SEK_038]